MSAELFDLARSAGQHAAEFVAAARPHGRVAVVDTKSSPTDVVTEIDRDCERLIKNHLLSRRPEDGFLGEEGGEFAGTSGTTWIVDPIDGTVNFVYGLPFYATSIAAAVDDEVVAGFVINIATGREFGAVKGEGAFESTADGSRRLKLGSVRKLDEALIFTGFNYVREVRTKQADAVARLLPHVRDIRRTGSAALDLCAIAAGHGDGYVEQGLKPWDLAAGKLIGEEAGIVFSGHDGVPTERLVVASHPAMAREFFSIVSRCAF